MQLSGTDEHCFYLLFAVERGGTGAFYIQSALYIYQYEDCGSIMEVWEMLLSR